MIDFGPVREACQVGGILPVAWETDERARYYVKCHAIPSGMTVLYRVPGQEELLGYNEVHKHQEALPEVVAFAMNGEPIVLFQFAEGEEVFEVLGPLVGLKPLADLGDLDLRADTPANRVYNAYVRAARHLRAGDKGKTKVAAARFVATALTPVNGLRPPLRGGLYNLSERSRTPASQIHARFAEEMEKIVWDFLEEKAPEEDLMVKELRKLLDPQTFEELQQDDEPPEIEIEEAELSEQDISALFLDPRFDP